MQTYLGRPELKAAFLSEIAKHEEADAIVKGTYGDFDGAFRGCAIGCSLHSLNAIQGRVGEALLEDTDVHDRYELELGLPTWLAYLEEYLFETLPIDLARTWPRRFAEAIPVGAVIGDRERAQILHWTLVHEIYGVTHATTDPEIQGHIAIIATALAADISGGATAEQREAAAWSAAAARRALA